MRLWIGLALSIFALSTGIASAQETAVEGVLTVAEW